MVNICATCANCRATNHVASTGPRSISKNRREPLDTDVVLGRGRRLEAREGNQAFARFTGEFLDMYKAAVTRKDKKNVTIQVVQTALGNGIRFLRQNAAKQYEEADHETIRVRVGQSLRYMMKQQHHNTNRKVASTKEQQDTFRTSLCAHSLSMEFDLEELLKPEEDDKDTSPCDVHPPSNSCTASPSSSVSLVSLSDSEIETIAASIVEESDCNVDGAFLADFDWDNDFDEHDGDDSWSHEASTNEW